MRAPYGRFEPKPVESIALQPSFVPPEPRRQQVKLGAVGAAGFGLEVAHGGEIALEAGEEVALGAALQHLGEEEAAGRQNFAGEIGGELDQADDAQLIGLAMAGGVGRHVGEDAVGRAAEPFAQIRRRLGVVEIHLPELDPVDRIHLEKVDRDRPGPCPRAPAPAPPRPGSSRRARRRDRRCAGRGLKSLYLSSISISL